MEEISLKELFFILRKWLWLIITLLIVSMLVSGLVSFYVLDKEYVSFTTLMVGKPKDYITESKIEYNDIILNQKLVSTYGELIKMRVVADKVIDNMDLPISYEQYRSKINVTLLKDTEIIKIEVNDNEPQVAADIANETAEVFMETVKDIMKVENVQVIDKAEAPLNPIRPRPLLNIAIAGILGVMLGIFIAFLIEFLDNTIKSPEDVEKYLGVPVLGTIPKSDN